MSHGKFLTDMSDDESAIDVSELPSEYRVKVLPSYPPFPSLSPSLSSLSFFVLFFSPSAFSPLIPIIHDTNHN